MNAQRCEAMATVHYRNFQVSYQGQHVCIRGLHGRALQSLGCPKKMVYLYPKNNEHPLEYLGARDHMILDLGKSGNRLEGESEEKTQRQGEHQPSHGWSQ